MDYIIPKYIEEAIQKLENSSYEAYIVGGSIRDLILNKEPADYDITTNAQPNEIIGVFKDYKTILTGIEFGTVIVVLNGKNIEITSYRIEGEYRDGRKPSKVYFTGDLEEDLARRDFTINSMAYNKNIGLIDPFNGRGDLKSRLIKTVGNPRERFAEDHLRILRAIRFASQLGFSIESNTYNACIEMASLLKSISIERIRDELFKILLSKKPSLGIGLMKDSKVLDVVLPELLPTIAFDQRNPHHDKNVFDHTLSVVDNTPPVLQIRLAALFHDIAKPHTLTVDEEGIGHFYRHEDVGAVMTRQLLNRLHCSNGLIKDVENLVKEHMTHHADYKDRGLKRLIARVGQNNIFHLLELQKADKISSNPYANIDYLMERKRQVQRILETKEPYEKKQLAISGNDILELGYQEGRVIGEILDLLMEKVLENPELNNKNDLIEIVSNFHYEN